MAVFVKFLGALLFFTCQIHGESSCTNADLKISQAPTGIQVGGMLEYQVSLRNTCSCVFVDIVLACGGFRTQEPIDHSILNQDGADCTINNGSPISPNDALEFKYAWNQSYNFTLKTAQIACS